MFSLIARFLSSAFRTNGLERTRLSKSRSAQGSLKTLLRFGFGVGLVLNHEDQPSCIGVEQKVYGRKQVEMVGVPESNRTFSGGA